MSRPLKALLVIAAAGAAAVSTAACGTQRISVSQSNPALHEGAVLFNQRCSGCHSLAYAATHGSAAYVRTAEFNNGPNFNIRCERPVTRVLYAIQNGGFSGAIMPQNIVVGQQAIDVAKFVSTYAGRQAPSVPGVTPCKKRPAGSIPPPSATTATTATMTTSTTTASSSQSKTGHQSTAGQHHKAGHKHKSGHKHKATRH